MVYDVIDDFEDGNITTKSSDWDGWTGDTAGFTAQTGTALEGSQSGELTTADENNQVITSRSAGATSDDFEFKWRSADAPSRFDQLIIDLLSGTTIIARVELGDGNVTLNGTDTTSDWSADTTYRYTFDFDFGNNQVTLSIDGTAVGTEAFRNSATASDWDEFQWQPNTSANGNTVKTYLDGVTQVGVPVAPSGLSVSQGSEDQLDLTWTDNAVGEDGYHVWRAESTQGADTANYSQVADIAADSTSHTDTSLEDGEKFFYRVTAYNEKGDSGVSNEDSATTVLSQNGAPSLDTSTAGQIDLTWTKDDDSSDGTWDVERSTDGGSSWADVTTGLAVGTTSYTDSTVDDGTQYDYRLERNTDHATTHSSSAQATSKGPAATSVTATSKSEYDADVTWTDPSTDETKFQVLVSSDGGATYSNRSGDLAADTTSFTDQYQDQTQIHIKVRTFYPDTQTDSSVITFTNYLRRRRTRGSKWYVEVVHPTSGNTLRPTVLDGVQRVPSANGLPAVHVPVPRDDKWTASAFEGATMTVFFDGEHQPIDELHNVETREDRCILHGRGGIELLDRVQKEYDAKAIHTAAEDLVNNETTYTANVDTPSASVTTNETLETITSTSDFQDNHPNGGAPANQPWEFASGELHLLQSCFTTEAEDFDRKGGSIGTALTDSDHSASGYMLFDASGEFIEIDFTTAYDIPSGSFEIHVRFEGTSPGDQGTVSWKFDEGQTGSFTDLGVSNGGSGGDVLWRGIIQANSDLTDPGKVSAGSHTLRIEAGGSWSGGEFRVDVVAPNDDRYTYTFDDTVDSDGFLSGPELFPDAVKVAFSPETVVESVSGGRVETTWDDTGASQQLALSNDEGATYKTSANSANFETDFADLGASLTFRATVSRHGTRTTATPTTGFNAQSLKDYTLKADLDPTPIVVNRSFDGSILSILQELADLADHIFAFERSGPTQSVEWTQPGARNSSKEIDIGTYISEKDYAAVHEQVAVYGSAQTARAESFTSNHGTFVDLAESKLQPGKEVVYDPSTGTQFTLGNDYEMDYHDGKIKTRSEGTMSNSTTYEISYNWRPYAEATASGVGGDPTHPTAVTIAPLSTVRACGQAATKILDVVKTPLFRTRATLPTDEVGWSVVEDIDLAEVPTNGNRLDVNQIEAGPGEVVISFASRQELGETVDSLESRLSGVSTRV